MFSKVFFSPGGDCPCYRPGWTPPQPNRSRPNQTEIGICRQTIDPGKPNKFTRQSRTAYAAATKKYAPKTPMKPRLRTLTHQKFFSAVLRTSSSSSLLAAQESDEGGSSILPPSRFAHHVLFPEIRFQLSAFSVSAFTTTPPLRGGHPCLV